MHKDAQECGRMLENIGEYRNMLKDAKKCRSTLEHVEGCRHGCKRMYKDVKQVWEEKHFS